MTSKVQVEIKAPVATITLNKPERLNALDLEVWEGIREAAETVDSAPGVRVVILQGAGGTQRLPRTIGISMAKELIYSARRFDAAEALRIGFVNHVYPAGEIPARAAELAAEIAANGPLAVQAAKQSIDGTFWREREAWLAWEADQAVGPLLSEDRQAGMRAAAERKRADFQGT